MSVIERIKAQAKNNVKHIVLAEGSEPRTVQAAVSTVESINKEIRELVISDAVLVSLKVFVHMMLTLHLTYESIFAKEPVNIFLKSARHGID